MSKYFSVGIDEVGRGPLAGPITVGAIAARGSLKFLRGIKDSKKLSAGQREEWTTRIRNYESGSKNFKIAIASVGPQIIDQAGIMRAARLAVGRCIRKLGFTIYDSRFKIMLDGSLYAPRTYQNQETIIKGDEKIPLIAAASIIAKVHRDKIMICLHKKFPQYGFDTHKGYGTKAHKAAIKKHGLSPIHRKSFRV